MAWRASEPQSERELLLVLPRLQPRRRRGAGALAAGGATGRDGWTTRNWLQSSRSGVQDGWPFVTYDLARQCRARRRRAPPSGMPGRRSRGAGDAATERPGLRARCRCRAPRPAAVPDAGRRRRPGAPGRPGRGRRNGHRAPGAAHARHRIAGGPARAARGRRARRAGGRRAAARHAGRGRARWTSPTRGRVIARLPPLGREIVRLPWTTRARHRRAAARHRQPRHRPPAAPALPQRTHPAARAGGLAADRGRRRRRRRWRCCPTACARAGVLPSTPGRRGAGCPAGADGARAHQRAGGSRAAGPGVVVRDAAAGQFGPGARCAGGRQRPGADRAAGHRDAGARRRAAQRAGAAPLGRDRWATTGAAELAAPDRALQARRPCRPGPAPGRPTTPRSST